MAMGLLFAAVAWILAVGSAQGQTVIATVPVGNAPVAIALNPVTNKVYVSNNGSRNVTVIDGTTNSTTTVTNSNMQALWGIAANPVTNKIYVANWYNVIVIDGATNSTLVVKDPNASGSFFVAVNPVTDKIYVANWNTNNITVIDGATNTTSDVAAGTNPHAIAVNEVTNTIYVPNWGSGDITVIDGATNAAATVKDPNASVANEVAVNTVTNKIYVTNFGSNNVTVIDGATNTVATITDPNGIHPAMLGVNAVTNKIYVENGNEGAYLGSNNITVIDGATNSFVTISDPNGNVPDSVAVNSVTNKIYFANNDSNNVTVLDGATNSITDVADPNARNPDFLALNSVTDRLYVVNGNIYGGSNNVSVIAGATPKQTFTTLAVFDGTNGSSPGSLVQGTDGNLYGTATYKGAYGYGTLFKTTLGGAVTTLYSFCSQANCPDGQWPGSGLILATDGNFYGTTSAGGTFRVGTVFRIAPTGKLTTLYNFCAQTNCTDGAGPGGLIQATDGNFYGTTTGATGGGETANAGTVFRITATGKLTTLYNFCAQTNCTDGAGPGGLIQATDGNFYGTTSAGGDVTCNCGTVFRISPTGKLSTLHIFKGGLDDGLRPTGLIQAADGDFYGTTLFGGAGYGIYGFGTVFRITFAGKFTLLHAFDCNDGDGPGSGVVQATDGIFYGTTYVCGAYGGQADGDVFEITSLGQVTTLHSFDSSYGHPYTGLVQATDGSFYGTTYNGTVNVDGTVYRLSLGLGPFVSFVRNSATVGAGVQILGQGFTGTSAVSFNGAPAAFKVKSDTYLTAAVPAGATTGFVTVTTPGGTLQSNKIFRVHPQIKSFSPTSGPAGTTVVITGEAFSQASAVTFDCKWKTSFTVDSDTQITAIVPTGAGSGKIGVTTAGGQTESAASFTVTP
jgi:uncharacterized repeat protein (TIGR03803 family)/YVTN family beta-propeller protein